MSIVVALPDSAVAQCNLSACQHVVEIFLEFRPIVGLHHGERKVSFDLSPQGDFETESLTEFVMHFGVRPPRIQVNNRVNVESLTVAPVYKVDRIHLDKASRSGYFRSW